VVPPALAPLEQLCRRHLKIEPLIVGPGIKTGVPILYENPREVGADRIVNAVAAHARWPQGAIIVDFGTATTFDVVTPRGDYAGGAIAPGLMVSADALYSRTSMYTLCRSSPSHCLRARSSPSRSARCIISFFTSS